MRKPPLQVCLLCQTISKAEVYFSVLQSTIHCGNVCTFTQVCFQWVVLAWTHRVIAYCSYGCEVPCPLCHANVSRWDKKHNICMQIYGGLCIEDNHTHSKTITVLVCVKSVSYGPIQWAMWMLIQPILSAQPWYSFRFIYIYFIFYFS